MWPTGDSQLPAQRGSRIPHQGAPIIKRVVELSHDLLVDRICLPIAQNYKGITVVSIAVLKERLNEMNEPSMRARQVATRSSALRSKKECQPLSFVQTSSLCSLGIIRKKKKKKTLLAESFVEWEEQMCKRKRLRSFIVALMSWYLFHLPLSQLELLTMDLEHMATKCGAVEVFLFCLGFQTL